MSETHGRRRAAAPVDGAEHVPGYRDLRMIGQGGFAVVYRAVQEGFERPVALKILRQGVDEDVQRRFLREVRITSKLTGHPYVVTVLDAGSTPAGRPYLTTEMYERGSLADRLAQEGPLPIAELAAIGAKIAEALATAHEAGILHRDVKPNNILINKYGEPGLADFGVAWLLDSMATATVLDTFSPFHAAPEVVTRAAPGPASDVYSLGSTLYHLATGATAFGTGGEPLVNVLWQIVNTDPAPLDDRALPGFAAVIARAMAKDQAGRYRSAADFATALRALIPSAEPASDALTMELPRVPQSADPVFAAGVPGPGPVPVSAAAAAAAAAADELAGDLPDEAPVYDYPASPVYQRSAAPPPPIADALGSSAISESTGSRLPFQVHPDVPMPAPQAPPVMPVSPVPPAPAAVPAAPPPFPPLSAPTELPIYSGGTGPGSPSAPPSPEPHRTRRRLLIGSAIAVPVCALGIVAAFVLAPAPNSSGHSLAADSTPTRNLDKAKHTPSAAASVGASPSAGASASASASPSAAAGGALQANTAVTSVVTGYIPSGLEGRCLDNENATAAAGNPVDVYTCTNSPAQTWTLRSDGSLTAMGLCLAPAGGAAASGTAVVMDPCMGVSTEKWAFQSGRELVGQASGLCLTVPGGSTASGVQLKLQSCTDASDQMWGEPPGSAVTGRVTVGSTSQCLDDYHSAVTAGNAVDLSACNGSAAQNWTLATDGELQILGVCAEPAKDASTSGTHVVVETCSSSDAYQQWIVQPSGIIVNLKTQEYLEIPSGSTANGTDAETAAWSGASNQLWGLSYTWP